MNLEVFFAAGPAAVMLHRFSCAGCLSSQPDVAVAADDVAVELLSAGDPQEAAET